MNPELLQRIDGVRLTRLAVVRRTAGSVCAGCTMLLAGVVYPFFVCAASLQAQDAQTATPEDRLNWGVARNPFWPVGWRPGQKEAVKEVVPEITADMFHVSAILLGPPNLAVVNGKDYEEGAIIPVDTGGEVERLRIDAIRDGFILLNYRGEPITVPLRRAAP